MGRIAGIAIVVSIVSAGCERRADFTASAPAGGHSAADRLPVGRWYPPCREALVQWLDAVAAGRPYDKPPVAVFDWDNTCIFGDVQETTFRYQLDRLALRLEPGDLAALVPECVNGVTELAGGVRLADVRADVLGAYAVLWPHIRDRRDPLDTSGIDRVLALPEHRTFRAKVGWLYDALAATDGIGERYAYEWVLAWMAGLTPQDARQLCAAAIRQAQSDRIERRTWRPAVPGRSGPLEHSFVSGLRVQPEMQSLMLALRWAGADVYVVSASYEGVVEAAAHVLGYPVEPDHIYGVRMEMIAGRLGARTVPGERYPFTYRAGKAELIRTRLPGAPVFVAGDSDTDYEMLTGFEATQVRLVINRNRKGDIRRLYEEAMRPSSSDRRTLLQGRDENVGGFQPARETTPLGENSPRPLGADGDERP